MSLCPICHNEIGTWIEDPILTPKGLAGDDYKGLTKINWHHIKEIQDARKLQEIELEISDKTIFSEITPTIPIHKNHILELRQSTEKLIANVESDLMHYFNYRIVEYEEVYVGTYKYGEKVADKTNWTDSGLINVKKIKAIHIEELRHPILSVLYDMEAELRVIPSSVAVNRAISSFPRTTVIRVYWGSINVTEKATYTPGNNMVVTKSSGKTYITAYTAGAVGISFVPPGFYEYTQEQCSFEGEEGEQQCIDNYMLRTSKTFTVSSYYHLSYVGELEGGGLLADYPSHSGGLYGSAGSIEGGSPDFSWDDQTYLIYGINAYWKCDFLNRTDLVISQSFRSEGLIFTPVSSYPYGDPSPNPNNSVSGEFQENMSAYNRVKEVCFEGEEGYWFNFVWGKTVFGDWYYEQTWEYLGVTSRDEEHYHWYVNAENGETTATCTSGVGRSSCWLFGSGKEHTHSISNGIIASASSEYYPLHTHTILDEYKINKLKINRNIVSRTYHQNTFTPPTIVSPPTWSANFHQFF